MDFNRSKIRIIWITPRSPLGAPDGARHATRSLVQNLTRLHIGVDLICLPSAGEPADGAAARTQLDLLSCSFISRSRSIFRRLPTLATPFTFRTFGSYKIRKAFKERLEGLLNAVDSGSNVCMVFDGLHPFAALSESDLRDFSSRCRRIVYRAHNVETILWEQCSEKARTPWFRWFFKHQAALVRAFELRIASRVNLIAPVSDDDAARFKDLAPGAAVFVTPIGLDFPDETMIQPISGSAKLELLFIGRLDWLPNRNGLIWFLENIWPRLILKRQEVSLSIAGVGDGRWLERFRTLSGVELLGRVDDVKPLYESCALSIAPLFQGSGTRVKILESARYARAAVSTALGAEGTGLVPGDSYFRVETEQEWLDLLQTIEMDDCRKAGGLAFKSIRERFDARTIAERFLRALDDRN